MKKIVMVICDIFTLAFLAGGYMIQYFTRQKLGMIRWINFHTYKYQEVLPLDLLKHVAVSVVTILGVFVIWRFAKNRAVLRLIDKISGVIMVVLILLYFGFTVFVSIESTRAYYFIMSLLGMAALVQVIKNLIGTGTKGHEEK